MSNERTLDVQTFVNSHKFSAFQWMIFAMCFLVVAADGFDAAAIGYVAPALIQQWHVDRAALGPVLSAALVGLAVGSLFAGPLSDRFGRKWMLVSSVFLFGAMTLSSAFATDLTSMTVLRFLTGLGLGAAMPNAVTLMSEYCPDQRRSVLTNMMFCGFPLGAAGGGFLAAWLLPNFGWQAILILGGVAPMLLAVALLIWMPESVRYLVVNDKPVSRILAILERIASEGLKGVQRFVIHEVQRPTGSQSGAAIVVSRSYLLGTVMLWTAYFMGLLIFYMLTSWLPLIIKDAGFSIERAAFVSALFPLGGGLGALVAGWLMDRTNAHMVVASAYGLTAVMVYIVGQGASDLVLLAMLIFAAGTAMNGAQTSMPCLAAAFYPTRARATGISWMMAVGRIGGISGAFLGAELMRRQMGFNAIFTLLAVPALVAAVALLVKYFADPYRHEAQAAGAGSFIAH